MSFGISVGDIIKVCDIATTVYKNCRDCPGEYKALTTEARQLTNVLRDIADKVEEDKIPASKMPQLLDSYGGCVEVLQELDGILNHYNKLDTKSKRAWDRLTWDSEKSRTLRGKLTASVVMLNGFWTSLIHDNQVLIIEALGRLERDYTGGHREESLASVEKIVSCAAEDEDEDDEDAAWAQIIRDLEDVGISPQDALEYRDFIIDWFVRAVNEGRLMERSVEHAQAQGTTGSLGTFPQDLEVALTVPKAASVERMPSWETPSFPPVIKRGPVPISPSLPSVPQQREPSRYSIEHQETSLSPRSTSRPASHRSTSPAAQANRSSAEASPALPVISPVPSGTQSSTPSINQQPISLPAITPPSQPPPPPGMEYYTALRPVGSMSNLPSLAAVEPQPSITVQQVQIPPVSAPSPPMQSPPAYDQLLTSSDGNLIWTAQRIVAAWNSRDFNAAEKHLENQLAAVERGETITILNNAGQPDRRLLRHLIGVCASYSGNFLKAKRVFESAFNGIYLSGTNIDEGDIAAARWLGDTCLHLNEPQNTALAWAVALEGSIERYGIARDVTRRVFEELHMLDSRIQGLQMLATSFSHFNTDSTDIFMNTHTIEKSRLVNSVRDRMKQIALIPSASPTYTVANPYSANSKYYRPKTEWKVAEGFLVQPLISLSSWPLQYDPTFSPFDAINLYKDMTAPFKEYQWTKFAYDGLPTVGLIHAKDLHYVTKRNIRWLVQTVETGLKEMGIEYRVQGAQILCRLNQRRSQLAFFESIGINFRKLQFRSMWGLKVTKVLKATRGTPPTNGNTFVSLEIQRDTEGFRDIVKGICERAEDEERINGLHARADIGSKATEAASPQFRHGDKVSYG